MDGHVYSTRQKGQKGGGREVGGEDREKKEAEMLFTLILEERNRREVGHEMTK